MLPIEEIEDRLRRQCPPGLQLLSVRRVPVKASAQVRSFCYRLLLPTVKVESTRLAISEVLGQRECWVERTKPSARHLDIRPFLRDLQLVDEINQRGSAASTPSQKESPLFLEIDLWMTPTGTARPDEVLGLLGLTDLLEAGTVLERCRLELHDEIPPL